MLNSRLLTDPSYLPSREEIETWKGEGTSRSDNWDDYVNHNPLGFSFEILNDEFIEHFVEYIKGSIRNLLNNTKQEVNIVETGAGSGRLCNFLRQSIDNIEGRIINIIATDDLSWEEAVMNPYFRIKRHFPVEIMDYKESMELDPDIVITSWIPKDDDWTKEYRKRTTVSEYILIRNTSDCGNDETWNKIILKNDGFTMQKAKLPGQMCFRDIQGRYNNSHTTSFIRK
ncbi:MAG: hypothetical protein PHZ26_02300 [Candidatus Gracilibacteria bacterium]|nr:hypothetical protein [Candidatus Gracilibacteria bacterium]MDD2908566.1 hypothetical protein [Candidatus Gracilibacteria bacterium]